MKLDRVTISGADNHVKYEDLYYFSQQYPFVEWGVLLAKREIVKLRYPDLSWISGLVRYCNQFPMKLSAHYCDILCQRLLSTLGMGFQANDVLDGPSLDTVFQRIQLNGYWLAASIQKQIVLMVKELQNQIVLMAKKLSKTDIILQISNNISREITNDLSLSNINYLYDASRGDGKNGMQYWRSSEVNRNNYIGFAGGINADNIREVLDMLSSFKSDCKFWVDMETGVRTNNFFDLRKADNILKIAKEYI